jgi:transglutaminase-like putative cysteine protease
MRETSRSGDSGVRPGPAPGLDVQDAAAATVALTALTVAAVYSLGRLFVSGSYFVPVMTAALAMHAVAWGCRRQRWRSAKVVAVSLLALVLVVSWLVLPRTTSYGLPLTGTLRAARQALHDAGTQFHTVTAPAPVTRGFLLVTVASVGALVLVADWAAFRVRTTVEAIVPSLTLFVFAAALGGHQHRTATIILELAAILAFVVVHQVTVSPEGAGWFANRVTGALPSEARTGAVIGAVAILAGVIIGPMLPGAASRAMILWRGADRAANGGTRTIPSPLVDLRTRLSDFANVEVFTVKSTAPEYWRLTSLDTFNGVEWSSDYSYTSVGHKLTGATTPTPGQRVDQDFAITGPISSIWLPAAYEPDRIDGIAGVSYNADSGSLISSHDTTEGLTYHVSSIITSGELTPQKLEAAGPLSSFASLAHYTRLPSLPRNIVDLARRVTAGKTSEYDKARALQDFFQSPPFVYDDTFTLGDGNNALEQFLFTYRRGYCQQFAGAYAVMARALGLPTRVAVGFSYGEADASGVWHVRDTYAHAWPEVYFPGFGWVPFEPTPGRGIPGAQVYTGLPTAEQGSPAAASTTPTTVTPATGATGPSSPAQATPAPRDLGGQSGGDTAPVNPRRSVAGRLLAWLLGVVLLGGAWLAAVAGTQWLRRRQRQALLRPPPDEAVGASRRVPWARWVGPRPAGDLDPEVPVLVAWISVIDLLEWWGLRRDPDETYLEFATRASKELRLALSIDRDAAPALLVLAADATTAEYAPAAVTDGARTRATAGLATIDRALRQSARLRQRVRLLLDPRLVFGETARRRNRAVHAAAGVGPDARPSPA